MSGGQPGTEGRRQRRYTAFLAVVMLVSGWQAPELLAQRNLGQVESSTLAVFPTNREQLRRLKRVRQLLADENYTEAVRTLQAMLDSGEDSFFHPDQAEVDDKDKPAPADKAAAPNAGPGNLQANQNGGNNANGGGAVPAKRGNVPGLGLFGAIIPAQPVPVALAAARQPGDPADKPAEQRFLLRSIKQEAQRLIGDMPDAGREVYENIYGPIARQMLQLAVQDNDINGLADVCRRYFHTLAGYEATYRLGAAHFDRGQPLAAALCFERLRTLPRAKDRQIFEPMLSAKTALAWQLAQMPKQAQSILAELKRTFPQGKLSMGGRDISLFDNDSLTPEWFSKAAHSPTRLTLTAGVEQWLQLRGQPSRTGISSSGSPFLNASWRVNPQQNLTRTSEQDAQISKTLEQFSKELADSIRSKTTVSQGTMPPSGLPAGLPLVVNDLVICKTLGDTRAYESSTGKLAWASAWKDDVLDKLSDKNVPQSQTGGAFVPLSYIVAQRAWRDLTHGNLSSNGEYVFSVEDCGFVGPWFANQGMPYTLTPREDNRLIAYEARTGKLAWMKGAPRSDATEEFAGAFFLGAPLLLENRAYVLTETGSEIRLQVLDPRTGKLEWSQLLMTAEHPVLYEYNRRMLGLTPSYSDGILICPTEAGAVIAVDLLSRSLLWCYRYPVPVMGDARMPRMWAMQQRWQRQNNGRGWAGNDTERWQDSTPIIADGHVLLSPGDTQDLICLRLADGSVVWKKPRGDGLYVAGVHQGNVLVVSRSQMSAYRLINGEAAWQQPTLLQPVGDASPVIPSGRGYLSGDNYYLPLTSAEVATIDIRTGRIVARTRSRDNQVPGNLIGVKGSIISQTPTALESFKQFDALEVEITARLEKNPEDSDALALRGEIHLQRGETEAAHQDLQRALEIAVKQGTAKPGESRVRELLVSSLLEGMRVDFPKYRALTSDIEKLISTPVERASYLRLLATGYEQTGESELAFETYLKFADPQITNVELDRVDGTLSVRRDRLVRARVSALLESAQGAARQKLEQQIRDRFAAVQEGRKLDDLRRFLELFGTVVAQDDKGRSLVEGAQLLLIDLLGQDENRLEQERWLLRLAQSSNKELRGRALARMTALLVDASRYAEAAPFFDQLATEFKDQTVLEGKTGSALVTSWKERAEVQRELAQQTAWPTGHVEVIRQPIPPNNPPYRSYRIATTGVTSPFFQNTLLELDAQGKNTISARNSLGKELWKVSIPQDPYWHNVAGNRAAVHGHLVVVCVGASVIAIDTLGTPKQPVPRILWRESLLDPSSGGQQVMHRAVMIPGVGQRAMLTDMRGQPLGLHGPLTSDYVCIIRSGRLDALDPYTGKLLWSLRDLPLQSEIFGDDEYVFVSPPQGDTRVYRAADGSLAGNRTAPLNSLRVTTQGRRVLARASVVDGQSVWEMTDVWEKKVLWSMPVHVEAKFQLLDDQELAIWEPTGRFQLISLPTGKKRIDAPTDPEPNSHQILVLRNPETYTLLVNTPLQQNNIRVQQLGFLPNLISGKLYGFHRQTGEKLWTTKIERQSIDMSQTGQLPMLVFLCQVHDQQNRGAGFQTAVTCLDQRTGKILVDEKFTDNHFYFVDLVADGEQKRMELKTNRILYRFHFTDKPAPDAAKPDAPKPDAPKPDAAKPAGN